MKNYFLTFFLSASFISFSQDCKELLKNMQEIESRYSDELITDEKKCWYLSYTVKVSDWDNEMHLSNVKYYKQGNRSQFFSKEANIFSDEKLMVTLLPEDRMLVINEALPSQNDITTIDFNTMRKNFLDSCEILSCKNIRGQEYSLIMKAKENVFFKDLQIKKMQFDFDLGKKILIKVTTTFDVDYKLRDMTVYYKELDENCGRDLPEVTEEFFDKKGRIVSKYREYEVMDNRDQPLTRNK